MRDPRRLLTMTSQVHSVGSIEMDVVGVAPLLLRDSSGFFYFYESGANKPRPRAVTTGQWQAGAGSKVRRLPGQPGVSEGTSSDAGDVVIDWRRLLMAEIRLNFKRRLLPAICPTLSVVSFTSAFCSTSVLASSFSPLNQISTQYYLINNDFFPPKNWLLPLVMASLPVSSRLPVWLLSSICTKKPKFRANCVYFRFRGTNRMFTSGSKSMTWGWVNEDVLMKFISSSTANCSWILIRCNLHNSDGDRATTSSTSINSASTHANSHPMNSKSPLTSIIAMTSS